MSSLIDEHELTNAQPQELEATAVATANAASDPKSVVAAAAGTLSGEQQLELAKELAKTQWPTGDTAKAAIYITGFVVAGVVLCVTSLIAWKAQGGTNSIASDLIVAASSLVSLLIGGLVGAYVQR